MNEGEIIDNCQKSGGIISDETIVSMHPWVDDPQKEMERIRQQKEKEQQELESQYNPFKTGDLDMEDKKEEGSGK